MEVPDFGNIAVRLTNRRTEDVVNDAVTEDVNATVVDELDNLHAVLNRVDRCSLTRTLQVGNLDVTYSKRILVI